MLARSLAATIALSLVASPAAIHAADARHVPVTVFVEVGDLDLADPGDRSRFQRRLENAAEAACATGLKERWARIEEQRCVEGVIKSVSDWGN